MWLSVPSEPRITDPPPDSEALIEERMAYFCRVSHEHHERDPASSISFGIKPDDAIGKAAYLRMMSEDLERFLAQTTDQQFSPEDIALMKEQMLTGLRSFIETEKSRMGCSKAAAEPAPRVRFRITVNRSASR